MFVIADIRYIRVRYKRRSSTILYLVLLLLLSFTFPSCVNYLSVSMARLKIDKARKILSEILVMERDADGNNRCFCDTAAAAGAAAQNVTSSHHHGNEEFSGSCCERVSSKKNLSILKSNFVPHALVNRISPALHVSQVYFRNIVH